MNDLHPKRTVMVPLLLVLLVGLMSASASDRYTKCKPDINCKLPNCRCWSDTRIPGHVTQKQTPQMVMLSFSFGLNNQTIGPYMQLLEGLENPNKCPGKGTFFVQYSYTDVMALKRLADNGHELGVTTSDGAVPKGTQAWTDSLWRSRVKLYFAGVPMDQVLGVRAPMLFEGGDDEFLAMKNFSMLYDASCLTTWFSEGNNFLWPYTYDYNAGTKRKCDIGTRATKNYPGVWQFSVPMMKYNGHKCSVLSDCMKFVKTASEVYSLLFKTFEKHYNGNRAPLLLFIDPQWTKSVPHMEGMLQFLDVIKRESNTWFLSMSQALDWVRFPVPMEKGVTFWSWRC